MHPAGSVLIEVGNTKVICAATYTSQIPGFLKEANPPQGWLTAEYAMLPSATKPRAKREVSKGKVKGRTAEIQRLIGRALRAVIDMEKIPGWQINIDCDVIQADGGTRTAAITGACIALFDAVNEMLSKDLIEENPFSEMLAAVSVGIINGKIVTDLCYEEDSNAWVDMNVVMTESGQFIEIQGTAEKSLFSKSELDEMLKSAEEAIKSLIQEQKKSLGLN